MTASTAMAEALNRIATFTSVRRTRLQDKQRFEVHGGEVVVLDQKTARAAAKLRKIADELESSLS